MKKTWILTWILVLISLASCGQNNDNTISESTVSDNFSEISLNDGQEIAGINDARLAEAKAQAETEAQEKAEAERKAQELATEKAKAAEQARIEAEKQAAAAAKTASTPQTLASGNFWKVEVATSGSVKFIKTGNTQTIQITNLNTSSAPDLGIYLSKAGSIPSSAGISWAIKLTQLRSHKGTQTYSVPANIDLSQYKSIAIHCTKYNKLFGSASLR